MKKMIKVLGLVALMTLGMSIQAFAGEWKNDNIGWWWQNDNGTYPVNKWEWLDGNKDGIAECYYFNESGYMLANTVTPDNYTVNENGAWIVNGVVQTKSVSMNVESIKSGSSENVGNSKEDKKVSEKNTNNSMESIREELRSWGLSEDEIDDFIRNQERSNYGGLH